MRSTMVLCGMLLVWASGFALAGEPECARNVVVTGYWPPTNEMLRQFSTQPRHNPGEWAGDNWRDSGYDVYAFFPEFPPDGNPTNDAIGDPGSVGAPDADLQVDYQDTSADFWRIVDRLRPVILITTSRGGEIGWEIEAREGGHGEASRLDASRDWVADRYGALHFPSQSSLDPRSWAAISTFRAGYTIASRLPMARIEAATRALNLTTVAIDPDGTSGNYISGFMGLHGLHYNLTHPHNVVAGHIHVGTEVPVDSARRLMEETLRVVIEAHPAGSVPCGG